METYVHLCNWCLQRSVCSMWGKNYGTFESKRPVLYNTRAGNRMSRPLQDMYSTTHYIPCYETSTHKKYNISTFTKKKKKYQTYGTARYPARQAKVVTAFRLHWAYARITRTMGINGQWQRQSAISFTLCGHYLTHLIPPFTHSPPPPTALRFSV